MFLQLIKMIIASLVLSTLVGIVHTGDTADLGRVGLLHPHVIGAQSRIWIVAKIIRHAASRGTWFATHGEIANYVGAAASD